MTGMQFRAVVVCVEDPCTYCNGPRRRHTDAVGPFETREAARDHGWARARNVFGSSTHRVEVEGREVSPWRVVAG